MAAKHCFTSKGMWGVARTQLIQATSQIARELGDLTGRPASLEDVDWSEPGLRSLVVMIHFLAIKEPNFQARNHQAWCHLGSGVVTWWKRCIHGCGLKAPLSATRLDTHHLLPKVTVSVVRSIPSRTWPLDPLPVTVPTVQLTLSCVQPLDSLCQPLHNWSQKYPWHSSRSRYLCMSSQQDTNQMRAPSQ